MARENRHCKRKNKELTDSYQNFIDKRNESVNKATSENQYYDNLWEELKKIVDENGKVNEGYEDRAKFITTKLGDLTGTEITLNDNVIETTKNLETLFRKLSTRKKLTIFYLHMNQITMKLLQTKAKHKIM